MKKPVREKTLLSVLIPTKNREEFTVNVVHQVLEITDERIQVVVHDNGSTNKLEGLLSGFIKDSRFKYYYVPELLSFVDNFGLGISKCDGEYITMIGDDDGINPFIMDVVDWAYENNVEAITPSLPAVYYWPSSGVDPEHDSGRLTMLNITCKVAICNPLKEVIKLLSDGCQNYLTYNLAKVYHGLVKKSVLDKIKLRTGKYIGGLSPDIYLSVATSLIIKEVVIIDYPLTISGICKRSGSADSATGKHTGKLEDAPHLRGHIRYDWSDLIPAFYSVETIWGDSALAAITDLKFNDLIKYFRIDTLSSYCIKLYPDHKAKIFENLIANYKTHGNSINLKYHLLRGYINGPIRFLIRKIGNRIINRKTVKIFTNIPDILGASKIFRVNIESSNQLILERLKQTIK